MLLELRKKLTLMCVTASTVILCLMALVSLSISEKDFVASEQEAFLSKVDGLVLYLRSNDMVDGAYIAQYEARGRLIAHVEDNGVALLPVQSAQEERAELLAQLHANAAFIDAVQAWGEVPVFTGFEPRSLSLEIVDKAGTPFHAGVVELRRGRTVMRLYVFGDTALQRAGILRRRLVFVSAVLAAAAVLAVFSWWFSGRAVAPVARSRKSQTEFIAAVSHEMRTPLAAIRNSLEAMRVARNEEDRERFFQIIDRECTRTTRLVADMLTLSSIDTQGWSIRKGPVEIAELVQETVETAQSASCEKGICWQVQLPDQLPLAIGDMSRMKQVLYILLDNAIRYSPPGGTIEVYAAATGHLIHLYIRDHGPGMTREQKENAFTRFYRAEQARTDESHYGLGLSIAWELVHAHDGKIQLEDSPGGGLTVHVALQSKM